MNLKQMEDLVAEIVQDDSLQPLFTGMINDAILELAIDFDFPTLRLLDPYVLPVNNSKWTWLLPGHFHKKLFRCAYTGDNGFYVNIPVMGRSHDIEGMDHLEGDRIAKVAATQVLDEWWLLIDPIPELPVDLHLWFYQRPNLLTEPTDVCRCIPPEYHERVIIPRVIIKNYRMLQDQVVALDLKSLQYWQGEEVRGLYGVPGESKGLINHFASMGGPPRRTGGRDPVGRRGYGR